MSVIKIITGINWILIAIYSGFVIWALMQVSKPSHEMPGVGSVINGVAVGMLLLLIAMNVTSYAWMKIAALILAIVILLIVRHIATH